MASKGFRSSTPKQSSFVWGPLPSLYSLSDQRLGKLHGVKRLQIVHTQTNEVCLGTHFIQILGRSKSALRQGFASGKTLGRRRRRAASGG